MKRKFKSYEVPTMRFVFDRKKVASKTRKGLVNIEVTYNRNRRWLHTGVKVYADQWDDRKKSYTAYRLHTTEYNARSANEQSE